MALRSPSAPRVAGRLAGPLREALPEAPGDDLHVRRIEEGRVRAVRDRARLQAAAGWILARELVILDEADSGLSYRAFLGLLETLRDTGAGIVVVTRGLR